MKQVKKIIDVSDVITDTELEVIITGVETFKIRAFIGVNLLRFAAWIIGCQITVKYE